MRRLLQTVVGVALLCGACGSSVSGGSPAPSPTLTVANPGMALPAARRLFADWRAGNTADATSVASPDAISDLFQVPFERRYRSPTRCSASQPLLCMSMTGSFRVGFQMVPTATGYTVSGVNFGRCSRTACHFVTEAAPSSSSSP